MTQLALHLSTSTGSRSWSFVLDSDSRLVDIAETFTPDPAVSLPEQVGSVTVHVDALAALVRAAEALR